jgi:hypothetical protein
MRKWLAVAASSPLLVAMAAHAQTKGLGAADVASVARSHQIDLRLSQQKGYDRPLALIDGMLVRKDVASNAFVGVGLATMYGRKKGSNLRIGDPPVHARKPAVTFSVRF